ncbi:MAG: hypothetical protein KDC30_10105 [Saprospiraceae bacterium]|nr:hypothetical protein [Saprospiraceae bacterium]
MKDLMITALALLLAASITLTSCQQEEAEPVAALSDEEALDLVEGALANTTQGLTQEALDAAYVAEPYVEKGGGDPCGMTFDSTVVRSLNKPNITANYTSSWGWTVLCTPQGIPNAVDYVRQTTGSYETTRLLSQDSAEGEWNVGNLLIGQTILVNGAYSRSGTQTSKVFNQQTYSSEFSVDVTDLGIDKSTYEISGGTGDFTLSGENGDGQSFSISGTITFLGNQSAAVTINGQTHTINW